MDNHQLALEIAKRLFTNGTGQRAKRLVLELPNGKRGGGWIETAVVNAVEQFLNEADREKEDK